jgi:hypothetical protein
MATASAVKARTELNVAIGYLDRPPAGWPANPATCATPGPWSA